MLCDYLVDRCTQQGLLPSSRSTPRRVGRTGFPFPVSPARPPHRFLARQSNTCYDVKSIGPYQARWGFREAQSRKPRRAAHGAAPEPGLVRGPAPFQTTAASTIQRENRNVIRYPESTWEPIPDRPGLPFDGSGGIKLVLHTTETPVTWDRQYPNGYGPHLTVDLLSDTMRVWQHIDLEVGSYTMRSARARCGHSQNYQAGNTYQIEMLGYASATPTHPDRWYQRLADLCSWFVANLDVPAEFPFPFAGAAAYGCSGVVRQSCSSFQAAAGIVGHQHAPCDNNHWDPGALDVARLRSYMEDDVALTPAQQALLDGLEAAGVTAADLNYLVDNLRRAELPATGAPAAQWLLGFADETGLSGPGAARAVREPVDQLARDAAEAAMALAADVGDDFDHLEGRFETHDHGDVDLSFVLGKVDPATAYADHTHPRKTLFVNIKPPGPAST